MNPIAIHALVACAAAIGVSIFFDLLSRRRKNGNFRPRYFKGQLLRHGPGKVLKVKVLKVVRDADHGYIYRVQSYPAQLRPYWLPENELYSGTEDTFECGSSSSSWRS